MRYTTSKYILIILLLTIFNACKILEFNKKKPPRTRFYADKREIELKDTVRLYWEIEDAQRVELVDFEDDLPLIGEYFVIPDTTTTYQLNVYREGEEVKKKRAKIRTYVPKISYFEVTDTVKDTEEIEVRWSTRNSEKVSITGIGEDLRSSGKVEIKKDTTTLFILKMEGKFHSDTAIRRTVVDLVEEIKYNDEIHKGQGTKLKWSLKRTDSVKIEGYEQVFEAEDEFTVKPDSSQFVNIIAYKVYGRPKIYPRYVTVHPPKIRLYGSKTVLKNEPATIGWSVAGGDSVKFNQNDQNVPFRGSMQLKINRDTVVNMFVFDDGKMLQRNFNIQVIPFRTLVNEEKTKPYKRLKLIERIDFDILQVNTKEFPDSVHLKLLAVDTSGYFIDDLHPEKLTEKELNRLYNKLYEQVNEKLRKFEFSVQQVIDTSSSRSVTFVLDHNIISRTPIIHGIKKYIGQMKDNDRVSIIDFGTMLSLRLAPTSDTVKASNALKFNVSDTLGMGHAVYAAVDSSLNGISYESEKNKIIVITNGNDRISNVLMDDHKKIHDLANRCRQTNTDLNIISMGDQMNLEPYTELTTLTGDYHYYVPGVEYVHDAINEILLTDRIYYRISYKPLDMDGYHPVVFHYFNRNSGFSVDSSKYYIGYPEFSTAGMQDNYWSNIITYAGQPLFPIQTITYFDLADSTVKNLYKPVLARVAAIYSSSPNYNIHIIGHSDMTGSKKMCDEIGMERALNVKAYLIKLGIPDNKIFAHTAGKEYPVYEDENTEFQAAENRRVDVLFLNSTKTNP